MRRLLKKRPSLQNTSPPIPHGVSATSPPLPSPIKDKVRASLDLELTPPDFGALEREEDRMKNVPPSAYSMGAGARPWGLTRLRSWKGKKRDPSPGPTARSPTGYNTSDPPPVPISPSKAAAASALQGAVGPGPASLADPVERPLTPLSPSLARYSSAPPGPSTDLHQSRQVALLQPSPSPSLLSSVSSPSASSQPTTDSTTRLIPTPPTRPSLHRKLTKRRPKSSCEAFELTTRANLSVLQPFELIAQPSATSIPLDVSPNVANASGAFPVPGSNPAAVPDGAEPAFHSTASSSSLNRNNTSSTASSNVGPATEESMFLESPAVVVVGNNRGTFGHVWEQSTPLSRSSTLSFREGDDELLHPKIPPAQGPEGFQTPNRPFPPDLPESPNGSLVASSQVTIDSTSTTTPASRLNISQPRLRVGTSHLETHPSAEEPMRRSVAFDIVDVVDITPEQSILRTRNDSRASGPSISRRRSSSLGAMSNTTSMYSVGEIEIATRTVLASPTTLGMEEILLTPVALTPPAATIATSLASPPTQNAFGATAEDLGRSTSYSARPPPLPPHLSAPPQMPVPLTSDAERSRPAQKSRPTVQRNGSLSRLWRKLSSSGSGDRRSPAVIIRADDVPPVPDPPKSRTLASRSPTDQLLLRKVSRETRETTRMKASIAAAPRPRTTSLSATKQSTPTVRRTFSERTPNVLPPARPDEIPAVPSLHKGQTKASVPPRSTSVESPISNGSGPAFRPTAPTRTSSRWSPPPHTLEESIRYRQSLVDIQDDLIFQRVLEDLADAGDGPDGGMMLMRSTSRQGLEMRARKEETQAWFVAREIIQGERRYGRLLAKGVALVRSHLESQLSIHTPPRSSASPPRKHSPKSPSDRLVRLSAPPSSLDVNIPAIAFERTPDIVHLRTIESHLSRLLSLSSSLCTAFEDDPSPSCIATAFLNAQEDLSTEIGGWAGEVGNLIAIGLGDLMDQQIAVSHHASSIDLAAMGEEEVRLGFGDIIILPIQRAARYQLLFRELVNKIPPADDGALKVSEALKAAERLGEECDRKQTFDLNSLRRGSQISSSGSELQFEGEARSRKDTKVKAKSQSRPKSMVLPHRRTSWLSGE